jgi:hypothetical protein
MEYLLLFQYLILSYLQPKIPPYCTNLLLLIVLIPNLQDFQSCVEQQNYNQVFELNLQMSFYSFNHYVQKDYID